MDDTRLFLAIGAREFVALEVSEYIKRSLSSALRTDWKNLSKASRLPGTFGTIGYTITGHSTRTRRCRDIHSTEIDQNGGDPMNQCDSALTGAGPGGFPASDI